ncbi:uncharacterized protein LOC108673619 isoform X2 [Hyalella azteca]|nr:uncharacterized protein LOC108673619 isoform X2 [Hyalella azteca]
MLPGNRTGASENLGIRSPNHCRIPALRMPEDFSPSPPFPLGAERQKASRDRLPSPQQNRRLTALNTFAPNTIELQEKGADTFSGTNCSRVKPVKTIGFRGEYERIPNTSMRGTSDRICNHRVCKPNASGADGYPVSEDDADNQCKGFGHSYYKPGGFSAYIAHTIFDVKRTRHKPRGADRRNSNSVYAKIPSCSESDDDKKMKPDEAYRANRSGRLPRQTKHEKVLPDRAVPRDRESHRLRVVPCAAHRQQKALVEDSPPLASSSRNTSADGSRSTYQRYDSLERKPQQLQEKSCKAPVERAMQGFPDQVKCKVLKRSGDTVNKGQQESSSSHSDLPRLQTSQASKEHRYHQNVVLDVRNSVQPSSSLAGATSFCPTSQETTRYSNNEIPVADNPNIWVESCPKTDNQLPSFRPDNATSSHSGRAYIYQGLRNAVNVSRPESSLYNTLPNLHGTRNNGRVSLLYHGSPHSSVQSLKPHSKMLEDSSSLGDSRFVRISAANTPLDQRGQIHQPASDPHPSLRSHLQPMMNYSFKDLLQSEIANAEDGEKDDAEIAQIISLQSISTTSTPSPPSAAGAAAAVVASHDAEDSTRLQEIKESLSLLDSRDIVDPTTASMSWDHLTPDPSPVYNVGANGNRESHYTPSCIKTKSRSSQDSSHLPVLSETHNFSDTFARQYELKPFQKFYSSLDSRIILDSIKDMELPTEINEEPRLFRKREVLENPTRKLNAFELASNRAAMEETRGRRGVGVRPTNINSRFAFISDTHHQPEESFNDSLRPSKKLFSSTENSFQKTDMSSGTTPPFLQDAAKPGSKSYVVR